MTLVDFQGTTDCSGNPNYPSADTADMWIVSVAGRIGGASGPRVDVGDEIFCLSSNAGGTHASAGDHFSIRQANVVKPVGGSLTTPTSGDFAQFADGTGQLIGGGYHPVTSLDGDGTGIPTGTAFVGIWINKGPIDCSGNPNYPNALNGWTYSVSVAGKIGGASGNTVEAGDLVVCINDNIGGTTAAVGASWQRYQANLTKGVSGPTGTVTSGAFASFSGTAGNLLYQAYTPETSELTEDGTTIPTSAVVYAAINSLREELT